MKKKRKKGSAPPKKEIIIHGICQCGQCKKIRKGNEKDLIYMDPPYHGVSNLYGTKAWKEIDFVRLRNHFHEMCCIGYKVILTMSDTPFIRELFRGYSIRGFDSLSGLSRKKVKELVITNLPDIQLKALIKEK